MIWVVRIVVTLFFGFVFFGAVEQYFHLDRWIGVAMAIVLAALTSFVTTSEAVKKFYDARKGPYELRKLKREEEAAERAKSGVIKAPDADELKKYGQSAIERTLDKRFRNAGSDTLKPKSFVVDTSEKQL